MLNSSGEAEQFGRCTYAPSVRNGCTISAGTVHHASGLLAPSGQNTHLFANTPKGAEGSAVIFSLIETAKESGLNPFEYLIYVLKNAPIMEKKKLSWPELMTPAAVKQILSSQC